MEISQNSSAQLASTQNAQSANRTENAQEARVQQVQSQTSEGNQQQTLRANEGNTSVNISSEAQELLASEQAQSRGEAGGNGGANAASVEETVSLQSGGTQSGKPR